MKETQQQLNHDDLVVMAEAYLDLSPYKESAHRLVTRLVLSNEAISDKYRDMLLRYLLAHHTLAEMPENALYQIKHFLVFAEHELLTEYVALAIKLKQCRQDQA